MSFFFDYTAILTQYDAGQYLIRLKDSDDLKEDSDSGVSGLS